MIISNVVKGTLCDVKSLLPTYINPCHLCSAFPYDILLYRLFFMDALLLWMLYARIYSCRLVVRIFDTLSSLSRLIRNPEKPDFSALRATY